MIQILQTVFVYLVTGEMSLKICLIVGWSMQLLVQMYDLKFPEDKDRDGSRNVGFISF
jgi:hypothetical protein